MLKVYVAGKYSADNVIDVLRNIGHGRRVCANLFALGYAPFCPWHDTDYIILNPFGEFTVKLFYDYSIAWLLVSDIMLVISGAEDSTGVIREIKLAKENNIPIVYSIQELLAFTTSNKSFSLADVCKESYRIVQECKSLVEAQNGIKKIWILFDNIKDNPLDDFELSVYRDCYIHGLQKDWHI